MRKVFPVVVSGGWRTRAAGTLLSVQVLLVLLAVATLSVLASNRALLRAGRALELTQLFASGLPFAGVGYLVGPSGIRLLPTEDLTDLNSVLALLLGVCGLILGLNVDLAVMRRMPGKVYAASAIQSGVTFAVVTLPLWAVLFVNTRLRIQGALGAAAVLGAAASVSSAHLALLWTRAGKLDRLRGFSLSVLAMFDDLVGMSVLALAIIFGAAATLGGGIALLGAAAGVGVLCGALTAFLIHRLDEGPELSAILIGMAAITAGAAAYTRLSTLIAGLCAGAVLSLVGGRAVQKAAAALTRIERPVYLFLLFLVGAHVRLSLPVVWLVLALFVSLRFVGKIVGGRLAQAKSRGVLPEVPELGYALLAQGGVSVCMAMEYLLLVPRASSQLVLDVVVMAAVLNEILAARTFGLSIQPPADAPGATPRV